MGFYKSLSTGRLRTTFVNFAKVILPIGVELVEMPYIELRAGVLASAIDVAIILGEPGRVTLLNTLALGSEQLVAALPENHRLAEKSIIYWPELKGERFLDVLPLN